MAKRSACKSNGKGSGGLGLNMHVFEILNMHVFEILNMHVFENLNMHVFEILNMHVFENMGSVVQCSEKTTFNPCVLNS